MSHRFWMLSAPACALMLACALATSSARALTLPLRSPARAHRIAPRRTTALPRPASGHVHLVWPQPVARTAGPRIVGGYGAVQSDWPFMAFVLHFDANGNPDFSCTGTVVAPNVVLTAGHCAVDEVTGATLAPSGFAVVTGSVDWTNSALRQVSPVSRVIVNPSYDPVTDSYDAALLVLSSPTTAPAIPLASSADAYLEQAGTGALIAGWGETYYGDPLLQTYLQWAPTVVQGSGYCSELNPDFDAYVQLCAVDPPDFLPGPATATAAARSPPMGRTASSWRSASSTRARSTATPTPPTTSPPLSRCTPG